MRLAILDDYLDSARHVADWSVLPSTVSITTFTQFISPADLARELEPFDILVVMRERTRLDRNLIQSLPNLKLVVTTGLRNASIDLLACKESGIPVLGTDGLPAITVDIAWLLILALVKRFTQNQINPAAPSWQHALPGGLYGKTLGIVGLGKIGSRMAAIGQAFGMNVIAWSQNLQPEQASAQGVQAVSKQQLFSQSDIVTLHLVLSDRTRHCVAADELALMHPGSYLVNTSRAGLVDEQALIHALVAGRIAGAGLDVFTHEPLPLDAAILQAPNLVLTPHLGYVTRDNYAVFYGQAIENVQAWLRGETPRALV
ncbi:MAG: D-2-hydroxyacid dehydrogenase family protein [Alcaligenaceae bacterium]|nr:D-2-hydroxyacid dehydrogenase family protein [Alcaligenaceae bacterium]